MAELYTHFETFLEAYTACALWSSVDDDCEPMDNGEHELSPETLARFEADCVAFAEENSDTWESAGWDDAQAGHDFWLTRNHHGAGFWDRDTGNDGIREKLTNAAEADGECELYIGDDGLIYAM